MGAERRTLFNLELLYADFKGTREERYLEAPSFSVPAPARGPTASGTCGIAQTDITSATIDGSNTLIKGTFNNVDLRVEDRFDKLRTKFNQISFSGSHEFNDQWSVDFLAGHASSKFDNPIQTTLTLDQLNVQNYSYDYSQGRVPLLSYGSANLTSPTAWFLTQVRERPQTADNSLDTVLANIRFKPIEALTISGGVNYKKYDFVTTELRRSNGTTANQEPVIPAALAAVPLASYTTITTLKTKGLGVPAGTTVNWLVPTCPSPSRCSASTTRPRSAGRSAWVSSRRSTTTTRSAKKTRRQPAGGLGPKSAACRCAAMSGSATSRPSRARRATGSSQDSRWRSSRSGNTRTPFRP